MRCVVFAMAVAIMPLAAVVQSGTQGSDMAATSELFRAIRNADRRAVETSLTRGANVNGRSEEHDTPLMYAAIYATTHEEMKWLLDRGADPNARDKRGGTALMRSVHDLDKVRLLLDRGADV